MSDQASAVNDRIDALPDDVDYSDPSTYAQILGYDKELPQDTPQEQATQGDTDTAAAAATEGEGQQATDPSTAAATAAKDTSSTTPGAGEAKDDDSKVDGVLTKDGKRVIPFNVLADTRAQLQQLQRLAEAQAREIQELKAGTSSAATSAKTDAAGFSTADLDKLRSDVEADMPEVAALIDYVKGMQQQVESLRASTTTTQAASTTTPATEDGADVQALIDERPMLARWQAKGGIAWDAAIQLDKQLMADPTWANKPMAERFDEVQRRVADQLGIELPASNATHAAAPAAPKTATARPVAVSSPMPTLTDLSGSAPATSTDPLGGLTQAQMVDKVMSMDLEDIRRLAGLSY